MAALLGVELFEAADEEHHLSAVGQRFLYESAGGATGFVVVHAHEAKALRVGRIGVVRDDRAARGDFVDEVHLVLGVHRADGDAVDAAREQALDHALLIHGALGRHEDFAFDAEFLLGRAHAGGGGVPERVHAVGDVGELLFLAGGGLGVRA